MKKIKLDIEDHSYTVEVAETEELRTKGLMDRKSLPSNEGMLFPFDEELEVSFWMKDTVIPLDIIFIDEDNNVTRVTQGKPNDEVPITGIAKYVLELNLKSGILINDQVFFEDEDDDVDVKKMLVLGSDGKPLMILDGGERIFSRSNTKTLIRMSKRAYKSKDESTLRALGRKIIKYLDVQDGNEPEYVSLPD